MPERKAKSAPPKDLSKKISLRTRQGCPLKIRLMSPKDTDLLIDFFQQLSPDSKWRRFNYAVDGVDAEYVREAARRLADVDNRTSGGALIALEKSGTRERIVAVVRLMRSPDASESSEAEAAITVRDDYQGQGLGTQLVQLLVPLAQRMRVRVVVANVASNNPPALRVFRKLNLPTVARNSHNETTFRISIPEPKEQDTKGG